MKQIIKPMLATELGVYCVLIAATTFVAFVLSVNRK